MGVTITFGTSAFAAKVTGISGGKMIRDAYDATHMGSAVGTDFGDVRWMEQCPADLASVEDFTIEMLYDLDLLPPIDQAAEAITIQCPPRSGQTTGAKIEFSGFMKEYGGTFTMRDLRRGQYVLAVTGPLEFTAGS